ncbi:hypothetical protein BESB_081550 [Besnoitia besnoiti]|uniref:Uncharacterized protein n=1 Tax=Besnoitia besnoiti TaxID=94643 RepID=A0A2A9MAI8_BESBE|nr:hypothetical protein BESB_081550 [Besnoitia besnoiti]PFH32956.1 hypothetical protein BESB_081550 [Besnoitia besnoiti]
MLETRRVRANFYAVRRSRDAICRRRISEGSALRGSSPSAGYDSHCGGLCLGTNLRPRHFQLGDHGDNQSGRFADWRERDTGNWGAEGSNISPKNVLQGHVPVATPRDDITRALKKEIQSRDSDASVWTLASVSTESPENTRRRTMSPTSTRRSSAASVVIRRPSGAASVHLPGKTPELHRAQKQGDNETRRRPASCSSRPAATAEIRTDMDEIDEKVLDVETRFRDGFVPGFVASTDQLRYGSRSSISVSAEDSSQGVAGSTTPSDGTCSAKALLRSAWSKGEAQLRHRERTRLLSSMQDRLLESAGESLPPNFECLGRRRERLMRASVLERLSFQTRWIFSRAPWVVPRLIPTFEE